jgi:large subunit ribosomal protein L6
MARMGRVPIEVPEGVKVEIKRGLVKVEGNGTVLEQKYNPRMVSVEMEDGKIKVSRLKDDQQGRAHHGLYRSLIYNMVRGVVEPFEKLLVLKGLGYRARLEGRKLVLELGFSKPFEYTLPEGIQAEVNDKTEISIKGADKQLVGQVAADIRSKRPPEPYKGKGVRYKGEEVIQKEGKLGGAGEALGA